MSKFSELNEKNMPPSLFEQIEAALDKDSFNDFCEGIWGIKKASTTVFAKTLREFGITCSNSTLLRLRAEGRPVNKKKSATKQPSKKAK